MVVGSHVKDRLLILHPFITHARNERDPFETHYLEPQYDNRDFEGQLVETQKVC